MVSGSDMESREGAGTVFYVYLGTETEQIIPAGSTISYAYANGRRIAKYSTYTVAYDLPDILGSTRIITDSTGKVLFTDNYQPFGQDNGTPTGSETYKFTGKPVSQTTGLYYEYRRWYDPSIGRFISPDPKKGHLSSPQSLNSYVYVTNNPTIETDPTGMDGCGIFALFCNAGSNIYNGATSLGSRAWNFVSSGSSYVYKNVVQPTTNYINTKAVQPTANFVETNVVQPVVNNVVKPTVIKSQMSEPPYGNLPSNSLVEQRQGSNL